MVEPIDRNILIITNGFNPSDTSYVTDLATAISQIGAENKTLIIDGPIALTGNTTVPSNILLKIPNKEAYITSNGYTLTINGPFEAGNYTIFNGFSSGDVTFNGYGVSPNPYWWGAVADDSTDIGAAWQAAIYSVASDSPGLVTIDGATKYLNARTVYLPHGKYKKSGTLTVPVGVIIEANNSVVTQTSADIGITFKHDWVDGSGRYGAYRGGLRNLILKGGNVGTTGILLDTVNYGEFNNIIVDTFATGILGWEVQYSSFNMINTTYNSVDGLVLTYHPDRPLLTCIDNEFHNIVSKWNTRYGLVLHASRYTTWTKIDAGRNYTADVVIGGILYDAVKGVQVSNNDFFGLKCEHNRDDVPSSGYAVLVSKGNEGLGGVTSNTITNFTVTRTTNGTLYDPYFKWLYNGGFNTIVNNPYDYVTAVGIDLHENPSVPGDYSIFRAIQYSGLIVNYGSHWQQEYIALAATDENDLPVYDSSRYAYTYFKDGNLSLPNLYIDGGITWSGDTSTKLFRTAAGILRTGASIKSDLAIYGTDSVRSILFSTESENEKIVLTPRPFSDGAGGDLVNIGATTITNVSSAINVLKVAPIFNQASGDGTNTVVYINPQYTTVNSGFQYLLRARESGETVDTFAINRDGYFFQKKGSDVISSSTISPTGVIFHVSGSNLINTINRPQFGFNGNITIIPDNIFVLGTSGNIAVSTVAVVNKAMSLTFDSSSLKWYPSY